MYQNHLIFYVIALMHEFHRLVGKSKNIHVIDLVTFPKYHICKVHFVRVPTTSRFISFKLFINNIDHFFLNGVEPYFLKVDEN